MPFSVPALSLQRGPVVRACAAGFCASQNCRKIEAPVVPGTSGDTCDASWSIVRLNEKSRCVQRGAVVHDQRAVRVDVGGRRGR